ncbi:helix-turn-helix transcriptional regulator [Thioalkalivibrio sulfidiphilus]|uniref:helix-turn-helix transcriptional regulator n=1 Tax=Thioalkalivibrio sulfidiphilus TaxID=1033854 RepID=UPI003B2F8630
MKLDEKFTDDAVLAELGERLARLRIGRGLTQAQLADEAGVGKRTVERAEAGHSVQLVTLVRLFRVLGLMSALDQLMPEPGPTPMERLKEQTTGRSRQRASGRRAPSGPKARTGGKAWTWGDES